MRKIVLLTLITLLTSQLQAQDSIYHSVGKDY